MLYSIIILIMIRLGMEIKYIEILYKLFRIIYLDFMLIICWCFVDIFL